MQNKWKTRIWAISVAMGCLLTWGSALAHHSDAEFNLEELVTLEATITRVEYVNPHMLIHFDVKNIEPERWTAYGGPPNRMARVGWTSQTVKPGEQLTVTGFPSKYGKKTMLFVKLVRANGEVIPLPDTLTGFATRRGLKP
jgi:hypothetical protein